MKLLIAYASNEGQTAKIAHRIEHYLQNRGEDVDVADVSAIPPNFSIGSYDGVMVAAPVYAQKHPYIASQFVQTHPHSLNTVPSIFVSVSLAAADSKLETQAAAKRLAQTFLERTGWKPTHTECVAGALAYTHYGFFKRMMLHWIMRRAGVKTDTSKDYEYTNWKAVEELAERFLAMVRDPVHA